jgi:hypothetical protein
MHNTVGNHTSLAAAGARQNKQRSVNGFHRFALLRIEFGLVEKISHRIFKYRVFERKRKMLWGRKDWST